MEIGRVMNSANTIPSKVDIDKTILKTFLSIIFMCISVIDVVLNVLWKNTQGFKTNSLIWARDWKSQIGGSAASEFIRQPYP